MQLHIRNGQVIAYYDDDTQLKLEDGSELVRLDREVDVSVLPCPDPRTDEEKMVEYRDRRRVEYPPITEQLDMLYWDRLNGTATWQDAIAAVKVKYPKPQ